MDAAAWQIVSIVGYSLSGILFIIVIIMFFKMNIRAVYGDLSGKNAKKHIQAIREQSGKKVYRRYEPSPYNLDRGELTEPIPKSKRLWKTGKMRKTGPMKSEGIDGSRQTGNIATSRKLERMKVGATPVPSTYMVTKKQLDETELLIDETELLLDETELLVDETQVLADETQLLNDGTQILVDDDETVLLGNTDELYPEDRPKRREISFTMVKDMKITHTDETISDDVRD
ncbi:hypothetical protein [Paucisalibacillus sp. EB02]|uniref:hypothetical protein n=1 Tax=Paucisalibacillus sp. EB02 TaxID=1347087 RepID=UPI0004B5422B|nr:hypothetical protein [Paucisalibacillus sp. EB02]